VQTFLIPDKVTYCHSHHTTCLITDKVTYCHSHYTYLCYHREGYLLSLSPYIYVLSQRRILTATLTIHTFLITDKVTYCQSHHSYMSYHRHALLTITLSIIPVLSQTRILTVTLTIIPVISQARIITVTDKVTLCHSHHTYLCNHIDGYLLSLSQYKPFLSQTRLLTVIIISVTMHTCVITDKDTYCHSHHSYLSYHRHKLLTVTDKDTYCHSHYTYLSYHRQGHLLSLSP
jgi:hypothetical protein